MTLVVIVNLDQALYSADFRALERMGQLMVQVAGRAGRDQLPGEVILQTHYPQHESLLTLLTSGYRGLCRGHSCGSPGSLPAAIQLPGLVAFGCPAER